MRQAAWRLLCPRRWRSVGGASPGGRARTSWASSTSRPTRSAATACSPMWPIRWRRTPRRPRSIWADAWRPRGPTCSTSGASRRDPAMPPWPRMRSGGAGAPPPPPPPRRRAGVPPRRAVAAGVAWERLIVDPGFGFGKPAEHNLALLHDLAALRVLGRPVMLGMSRKSTIGRVLDLPAPERLEGTLAPTALGIAAGVHILPDPDVQPNRRAARMSDAIV